MRWLLRMHSALQAEVGRLLDLRAARSGATAEAAEQIEEGLQVQLHELDWTRKMQDAQFSGRQGECDDAVARSAAALIQKANRCSACRHQLSRPAEVGAEDILRFRQ